MNIDAHGPSADHAAPGAGSETAPEAASGEASPARVPASAIDHGTARRPVGLALARVHLRLGSLALARAELEILGGRGELDMAGHVDLAEARWRTGDLAGAGEAASIAIGAGEDAAVVLAIAAEAASALGRPNEARRLATKAMEREAGPVDRLFAGMPRSGVWPADETEPAPTAGTLFHHEPSPAQGRRTGDTDPDSSASRTPVPPGYAEATAGAPMTLGFWDADGADERPGAEGPDPAGEMEAARAAMVAGSLDEATLRFALALRLAPALAPAILEATDGVSTPEVNVVRGDAYRLVGLETEARRAYAAAAWSGAHDRRVSAEGNGAGPSEGSDRAEEVARVLGTPRTPDA